MPLGQCPKCQAQFQASDDLGGIRTCPDCRFQIRVPELRQEQSAIPLPPMITCECGKCGLKFQVVEERAGTTCPCAECNQPVDVSAALKRSNRFGTVTTWMIVAAIVAIFVLSQISIVGSNPNTTFGTVGVPFDPPPGR